MQIATWNVNSLKVRLPQVLDWLMLHPEISALAIQETKLEDGNFPGGDIKSAGFHVVYSGQKTYNGVAIVSRHPLADITIDIPDFIDPQKRVIAATLNGLRLICVYVPNGQALDSDKYPYKLGWLEALTTWLAKELQQHPKLVLTGDFNIAPEDCDVHDPAKWEGHVLVSPPERAAWQALLNLGFTDAFRLFEQPEKSFSWWDYRSLGFRRNAGLRIDHILLSPALVPHCTACAIDKEPRRHERPSDHTPVITVLDI